MRRRCVPGQRLRRCCRDGAAKLRKSQNQNLLELFCELSRTASGLFGLGAFIGPAYGSWNYPRYRTTTPQVSMPHRRRVFTSISCETVWSDWRSGTPLVALGSDSRYVNCARPSRETDRRSPSFTHHRPQRQFSAAIPAEFIPRSGVGIEDQLVSDWVSVFKRNRYANLEEKTLGKKVGRARRRT